jgi:hypothetical protein
MQHWARYPDLARPAVFNSNRFDHFLRINCGAPYSDKLDDAAHAGPHHRKSAKNAAPLATANEHGGTTAETSLWTTPTLSTVQISSSDDF